jgi:hypothetical protein
MSRPRIVDEHASIWHLDRVKRAGVERRVCRKQPIQTEDIGNLAERTLRKISRFDLTDRVRRHLAIRVLTNDRFAPIADDQADRSP